MKKTNETEWRQLYDEGTIKIPLIKEMSAGGYEAVLLCEFAIMQRVSDIIYAAVTVLTWNRPNVSLKLVYSLRRPQSRWRNYHLWRG